MFTDADTPVAADRAAVLPQGKKVLSQCNKRNRTKILNKLPTFLFVLLLLFLLARFAFCLDGWLSFRGSCYYLGNHAVTWTDAEVILVVKENLKAVSKCYLNTKYRPAIVSCCRASVQALAAVWRQSTTFGSITSFSARSGLEVTL